jgi:hypothetical protein
VGPVVLGGQIVKRDSLLAHCVARAAVADGFVKGKSVNWAAIRATPKAARVAGFVVLWAIAKHEHPGEPVTTEGLCERWNLTERSVGRYRAEFRELFPEYETPDVIAGRIVAELDAREVARLGPLVHVAL